MFHVCNDAVDTSYEGKLSEGQGIHMQYENMSSMIEIKTLQTDLETTQHIGDTIQTTSSVAVACTQRRALLAL